MENSEVLLALLRELPKRHFERETEFPHFVVPRLAEALGFGESETFYEYGFQRQYADVVFAASRTSSPWLVLELKGSRAVVEGDWIYQLRRYLEAFGCRQGLVLSPTRLIAVSDEGTARFDLTNLNLVEAEGIVKTFGRRTRSESTNLEEPSSGEMVRLIEATVSAGTAEKKGKTLEALAAFLINGCASLRCKYANLITRSSEIDLVIEYDESKGRVPTFDESGRYCLVECKNWSLPVGAAPLRDFIGKLRKCKVQLGIIFSKNGITGVDSGMYAVREIHSAFDSGGPYVLVFSLEEIRTMQNSEDFISAIDSKADALRFDMESL